MLARNVTFMSDVVYIFYKFDKSASKKSSHIYFLFFCFVFRLGKITVASRLFNWSQSFIVYKGLKYEFYILSL